MWIAATNRRFRPSAAIVAIVLVAAAVASLVMVGRGVLAVVTVIFGIAVASALGTLALRWEVHQAIAERWHDVPATTHGVVLMNPQSGNGKITKLHLVDEARRRGSNLCCWDRVTTYGRSPKPPLPGVRTPWVWLVATARRRL